MPDQAMPERDLSAGHLPGCRFRLAVECRVAIECDHGFDVCPTCDPCTCSELRERRGRDSVPEATA